MATANPPRAVRNTVVICLLLAFPIYSNLQNLWSQWKVMRPDSQPYFIDAIDRETKPFLKYVASQPYTGVFSDTPLSDPRNAMLQLELQYPLAPSTIVPMVKTHYAVAQLRDPATTKAFLDRERYRIVISNPDGVDLLEQIQ